MTDVVVPSFLQERLSAPFVVLEGPARSLRLRSARGRVPFFSLGFPVHGSHHAKASNQSTARALPAAKRRLARDSAENPGFIDERD